MFINTSTNEILSYRNLQNTLNKSFPRESPPTGWNIYIPPAIDPAEVIPQTVSKAQGKAALIQAGYWQDVLDYVEAIPDPTQKLMAQVALNDTTEWKRTSPFLIAAAEEIELTEAELDQLFITASGIEL